MFWPVTGYANAVIDERHLDTVELDSGGLKGWFLLERFNTQIASLPLTAELLAIPGAETDALVQVGNDLLYLDSGTRDDTGYVLTRFGTTLVESIARRLFEEGLDSVLDTQTQLELAEV